MTIRITNSKKQETYVLEVRDESTIDKLCNIFNELHEKIDYALQTCPEAKHRIITSIVLTYCTPAKVFFVEEKHGDIIEELCFSLESKYYMKSVEREK